MVTTDKFEEMDEATAVEILRVRYRVLTGFGVDPEEAAVMAAHPELRLMEVIDFVRRGFPARTALRIVLDAHASHAPSTSRGAPPRPSPKLETIPRPVRSR